MTPTSGAPQARTALHTRLENLGFVADREFAMLDTLLANRQSADAGELLVMEEQEMDRTYVVLEGWAIRYKTFEDGRRQILNIMLPGDVIGLYSVMLRRADYGIEALTDTRIAVFPAADLVFVAAEAPRLMLALSWIAGQGERQLDQQLTRVGRRHAAERMAHLFVELHVRLRRLGLGRGDASTMPMTQTELADTLGMSHVHANRTFRTLVKEGLVALRDGNIVLLDVVRLAARCQFDASYLEQPEVPTDVPRVFRTAN